MGWALSSHSTMTRGQALARPAPNLPHEGRGFTHGQAQELLQSLRFAPFTRS